MLRSRACRRKMRLEGSRHRSAPARVMCPPQFLASIDARPLPPVEPSRAERGCRGCCIYATRIFTRPRDVLARCVAPTIRWHHSFTLNETATNGTIRHCHERSPIRYQARSAGTCPRDRHRMAHALRRFAVIFDDAVRCRDALARLTGRRSAGRTGGTIGRSHSPSPMAPPVAAVLTLSLARRCRRTKGGTHA